MKRLIASIGLAFFSLLAAATTLNPVQLLNPAGSTSGQAIVSTGTSSAPAWGGIGVNGIAAISANTVLANATGSSAAPTAFAMPSCSSGGNALNWTSGTGFTCATITNATGRLLNVQRFTSSGTYTPTAGTNSDIIYGTGGGGGGGGCAATSSTQVAIAGAGTAGSWGVARILSPTSQTVTIGAAGAGGAAGANAGTAGGQTSVGTYLVAPGGGAGAAGGATTLTNNTSYGSPATAGAAPTSSGTLLYGAAGQWGIPGFSTYNSPNGFPSTGGSGPFGTGTQGGINSVVNASGFGAGAGGCYGYSSGAATAGGTGTPGLVVIYEYN